MARKELEEKLTPAAREMIEEVVADYRDALLDRASESAKSVTGEMREISVHDLLRSVQGDHLVEVRVSRQGSSMVDRLVSLYAVAGVTVGGSGITMYLYQQAIAEGRFREMLPLIVGALGLLLGLTAYLMGVLKQARATARGELASGSLVTQADEPRFITLWIEIEDAMRAADSTAGAKGEDLPLSRRVEKLTSDRVISAENGVALRRLLQLRNRILHRGDQPTPNELAWALQTGRHLLEKLRAAATSRSLS